MQHSPVVHPSVRASTPVPATVAPVDVRESPRRSSPRRRRLPCLQEGIRGQAPAPAPAQERTPLLSRLEPPPEDRRWPVPPECIASQRNGKEADMGTRRKAIGLAAAVVAIALVAAACGGDGGSGGDGFQGAALTGAGATFPDPIYETWFKAFRDVESGAKINYQAIGSGGGVTQFTAQTVDFGASDAP